MLLSQFRERRSERRSAAHMSAAHPYSACHYHQAICISDTYTPRQSPKGPAEWKYNDKLKLLPPLGKNVMTSFRFRLTTSFSPSGKDLSQSYSPKKASVPTLPNHRGDFFATYIVQSTIYIRLWTSISLLMAKYVTLSDP